MKAILLMIAIFLLLIGTFVIIWLMTADRAGGAAVLPENIIEYTETETEAVYSQMFI